MRGLRKQIGNNDNNGQINEIARDRFSWKPLVCILQNPRVPRTGAFAKLCDIKQPLLVVLRALQTTRRDRRPVIESGQVCFDDTPRCKHVCAYGVHIVSIFDVNRREIAVNLVLVTRHRYHKGQRGRPYARKKGPKNDSPDPYAQ